MIPLKQASKVVQESLLLQDYPCPGLLTKSANACDYV